VVIVRAPPPVHPGRPRPRDYGWDATGRYVSLLSTGTLRFSCYGPLNGSSFQKLLQLGLLGRRYRDGFWDGGTRAYEP
jgi:hypothetical protein